MLAYVHCLSFILFLANIGGLMGLCLGFSLLSVVELIYFFTLRWCVLCCRRKGGGGGGIQNMVIWAVKFSREGRDTKLEGDSQNLRLINGRFPTISSHFFFGNYMNMFQ